MKINLNDPEIKAIIIEITPFILDAAKKATGSLAKFIKKYLQENADSLCIKIAIINILVPVFVALIKSLEDTGSVKVKKKKKA